MVGDGEVTGRYIINLSQKEHYENHPNHWMQYWIWI